MIFAANASAAPAQTLRGTSSSFPDYMDPALSYTAEGWVAMYDTYIPLLTYRRANGPAGAEVVPGLAKSLPRISADGKTYTLFLRKGLRYSNGKRVRASDFEFAVERMLRLYSSGSPFYLNIVGARRFERKRASGISGIVTNDQSGKIVIHLGRPRNDFTSLLALLFVAPVPPETPLRDQSFHPPPATGPYVITDSKPTGWSYARNPEWKRRNAKLMPELPSGHVGKIRIAVVRNPFLQAREVETGKTDWMLNPPPGDYFTAGKRRFGRAQFKAQPTPSTYYFWMNTTKPPFNNLEIRRAVNYAIDPAALEQIYSGQIARTQQVLPPGMPGYEKFELYPHDLAKAKAMIQAAHPSDMNITVWTDTEGPNNEAGEYYEGILERLGFHTTLKVLNADNYFTVIGNQKTPDLDTGWSNWFEDFPHPNDFFQPLLAGESILPSFNGNFARIDVPSLNQAIAKLNRKPWPIPTSEYAALDRSYMELAPWAPYGTPLVSTFVSSQIDLDKVIYNTTFGEALTSFQFK